MASMRLLRRWAINACLSREAGKCRNAAGTQRFLEVHGALAGSPSSGHPYQRVQGPCRGYCAVQAQNADPIIRSPFPDIAIPSDVSLIEHLFDDFGRYGTLTALVSS